MRFGSELRFCLPAVCVLALLGTGEAPAAEAWMPTRPVELIVQSAPGGGTDSAARLLQRIIESHHLASVPVTVVNKPGGSGNVALSYLNQHAGDGHYLQIASAAVLTSYITGNSDFNYTDFTPIVQLNSEYITLGVKADSSLKTGKDIVDALAKDPTSLSIAIGTARGGVNHVVAAKVAEAAGADPKQLKAVVFKSSSESATALLGGHVDVAASSASVLLPYVPDQIRLVAISSPKRLDGALADVATWKEQDVDINLDNFRMVLGAPDLDPEQVKFWEDLLRKVMETEEWRKDLQTNSLSSSDMATAEFVENLKRQYAVLSAALGELGMAEQSSTAK